MDLEAVTDRYIAFAGERRIASGKLSRVARKAKQRHDEEESAAILVFEASSSRLLELDLRGSLEEVLERVKPAAFPEAQADKRGPGRPKLGVIPREITLLPRHWEWLNEQPGGASVALRKLVEEARRVSAPHDQARRAQESVYRFMTEMAGDRPNYEEALRAFYAKERGRLEALIAGWPKDIRDHLLELVSACDSRAVPTEVPTGGSPKSPL